MDLLDLSAISPADVKVGDKGTVWSGGCGQGGTVTAINADGTFEITGPAGNVRRMRADRFIPQAAEDEQERFRLKAWRDWESGDYCEEFPNEACELAYQIGWSAAVRNGDRDSIARYADSDVAPSWFDPSIAGERWSDDD